MPFSLRKKLIFVMKLKTLAEIILMFRS